MSGIYDDGAMCGAARMQPVEDVVTTALSPAALAASAEAVQSAGADGTAELARQRQELLRNLVTAFKIEAGTTVDGALSYDTGSFADAADWLDRARETEAREPTGGHAVGGGPVDPKRAEILGLHALLAQTLAVVGHSLRIWAGEGESAAYSPSTRIRAGGRAQRDLDAAREELIQLSTELEAAVTAAHDEGGLRR